jgi:hypothetical protein
MYSPKVLLAELTSSRMYSPKVRHWRYNFDQGFPKNIFPHIVNTVYTYSHYDKYDRICMHQKHKRIFPCSVIFHNFIIILDRNFAYFNLYIWYIFYLLKYSRKYWPYEVFPVIIIIVFICIYLMKILSWNFRYFVKKLLNYLRVLFIHGLQYILIFGRYDIIIMEFLFILAVVG